jgi:hypothetical protein
MKAKKLKLTFKYHPAINAYEVLDDEKEVTGGGFCRRGVSQIISKAPQKTFILVCSQKKATKQKIKITNCKCGCGLIAATAADNWYYWLPHNLRVSIQNVFGKNVKSISYEIKKANA